MDLTPSRISGPQDTGQSPQQGAAPGGLAAPNGLSEELVRQVAERVYRLLMQELRYEHERLRLVSKKSVYRKGGR